jgi:STE24 endopeptidase
MNADHGNNDSPEAKIYAAIKLRLSIFSIVLECALLCVWAFTPLSRMFVNNLEYQFFNPYVQWIIFSLFLGASFFIVSLILDYYGGFCIEHDFGLSTQTHLRWIVEQVKSLIVGAVIGLPLSIAFYFCVRTFGGLSYLVFATVLFLFSIVLSRIAPVIIFPLFYKFTPLTEGEVHDTITTMLEKEGIRFRGIYSFDMSRNTKKANAALAGLGGSRRIILSDTLLASFTPDEIGAVFAHELGHFKRHHIAKQVVLSGLVIYGSFFLCGTLYGLTVSSMGFINQYDIAALPVFALYLMLFGLAVMPVNNAISRKFETEADDFAVRTIPDPRSFIRAMERLASMNLSEKKPSPVVEAIFYGHPSIARRIESARSAVNSSSD